jgi:hypothetical protein
MIWPLTNASWRGTSTISGNRESRVLFVITDQGTERNQRSDRSIKSEETTPFRHVSESNLIVRNVKLTNWKSDRSNESGVCRFEQLWRIVQWENNYSVLEWFHYYSSSSQLCQFQRSLCVYCASANCWVQRWRWNRSNSLFAANYFLFWLSLGIEIGISNFRVWKRIALDSRWSVCSLKAQVAVYPAQLPLFCCKRF